MSGSAITMLHGRLPRDPEQRSYKRADGSTGTMVNFSIAVDARFGDNSYFHDCTAYGRTGEVVMAHLKKGREVVVWGEPVYNDKNDRRFYTVNVDRVDFCGRSEDVSHKTGETFQEVSDATPF